MHLDRYLLLFASLCAFITAPITAQEKSGPPMEGFTYYPPSVYMQVFQACSPEKPCTRTDNFRVVPLPKGCCIMSLTNGDGKGNDEVHAYEAFLNGKRVLPEGGSRNAQAAVRIQTSNTITLVLTGKPSAKVFVLITYDPRQFAVALLADLQKGEEKTQTCDISSDSDIGHPTTVLGSSQ